MTDEALAQIPDAYRYGTPILIRADGATKAWLAHLRILREQRGLQIEFSVGFAPEQPAERRHRWVAGGRVDGRGRRRR